MPMHFKKELLPVIKGYGFEVIKTPTHKGDEIASIARRPIVIPYAFEQKDFILPHGDETILEDEEVEAILRWIETQTVKKAGN
jgi:hypothetical protein